MSEPRWSAVDEFITERLLDEDEALTAAQQASAAAGLPPIAVSAPQGKMLHLLARMIRAGSALELGTLGGYSTIWLGRALGPAGRLVTIELDPRYAEVAAANIERAGLSDVVEQRIGAALDLLPGLAAEGSGPFDLIFIDADKENTPEYFDWALELAHHGSLIVVDNVVRGGAIVDAGELEPRVDGMRRFHEQLAADRNGPRRVSATTIQTVGTKGYDGFTLALVEGG